MNQASNNTANIDMKRSGSKGKFQFTVNIKDRHNSIFSVILPGRSSTVSILKHRICQARGIQPHLQTLIFNTTTLSEGVPICNYGITHGSTILLVTPGGSKSRIPKNLELGVFTDASSFNIEVKSNQTLGELKRRIMNLMLLKINGNTYGDHTMKKKIWNMGIKQGTVVSIGFQGASKIKATARRSSGDTSNFAQAGKGGQQPEVPKLQFYSKKESVPQQKPQITSPGLKPNDDGDNVFKVKIEEPQLRTVSNTTDQEQADQEGNSRKRSLNPSQDVQSPQLPQLAEKMTSPQQSNLSTDRAPVNPSSAEYQKKVLQSPSFKVAKYVKLIIQTEQNQNFTFSFIIEEKIRDIKKKLHKYTAVPIDDQILQFQGVALEDSKSIEESNLSESSIILMKRISTFKQQISKTVEPVQPPKPSLQSTTLTPTIVKPQEKPIMVTVEENSGMRSNYICDKNDTIYTLQKKWYKTRFGGDDTNPIAITLNGLILDEEATLVEQGIRNGTNLKAILISRPVTPIATRGLAPPLETIQNDDNESVSEMEFTPIEKPNVTHISKSPLESLPKSQYPMDQDNYQPPAHQGQGQTTTSHYINFQSTTTKLGQNGIQTSTFEAQKTTTLTSSGGYVHSNKMITKPVTIEKTQQITSEKTIPQNPLVSSKYVTSGGLQITSDMKQVNVGKKAPELPPKPKAVLPPSKWRSKPIANKAFTEFGGGKFNDDDDEMEETPDDISCIGINVMPKKNSKALKIPQNRLKNASLTISLVTGQSYSVRFDLDKRGIDLKAYLEQVVCISRNTMKLMFKGNELEDGNMLMNQGVKDGDKINILIGRRN